MVIAGRPAGALPITPKTADSFCRELISKDKMLYGKGIGFRLIDKNAVDSRKDS